MLAGLGLGLLSSLGGGLASSLGDKLGESLGLTPDASSSQAYQLSQQAMDQAGQQWAGLLTDSIYSAAGDKGAQQQTAWQNALDNFGPSAGAVYDATSMRGMGQSALNNAGSMYASAQQQAERNIGNQLSQANMAGMSPGQRLAMANAMGQGAGLAALNTLQAGQQARSSALATALGATQGAQGIMNQDLTRRYEHFVRPHEAQVMQGAGSFATNMANLGGTIGGSADQARTNPLAGGAMALGDLGGQLMGQTGAQMNDWLIT